MMIAALYVAKDGCYTTLEPGIVDAWDIDRDARQYSGPHPVVAHPPCARWCQLAPVNEARYGHKVGDDGGCFAAALAAVREWGGVLEHPAYSIAWRRFGITRPRVGAWLPTDCGGWTTQVAQRNYGHRAVKKTWLYYVGAAEPPPLDWSDPAPPEAWISADRPRAELAAMGIGQLSKKEAKATPPAFRDLLLALARASR